MHDYTKVKLPQDNSLTLFPQDLRLCSHTCDLRHATCHSDIFAANIFSYIVHTLATCDRDKFAHVAILSHEGGWGNGGRV